jgi:hemerythrin-like metal-binding protein
MNALVDTLGNYMTQNEHMDQDHAKLVQLCNEIGEYLHVRNFSMAYMVIETLNDYLTYHCKMEEALMQKVKFPHLEYHRKEHLDLRGQLIEITATVMQTKDSNERVVIDSIIEQLKCIIFDHVTRYDMQFAKYLELQPK